MKKSFKILFLINLLLLSVLYLYGQENKDKINIKKAESFTLSESQKLNADAALKVDAMTTGDKELYISPLNAPKWEKGGIFEGYTPKDEIQSLRTQNSKKFRNPDGSITAQIGGNYHYADDFGKWQDIDFTITKSNYNGYAYENITNRI